MVKPRFSALDIIAWMGTMCIIVGYALFSVGIFHDPLPYHMLNFFSSIAVAAISFQRRVWQPFTINAVFALVALIAIIRICL